MFHFHLSSHVLFFFFLMIPRPPRSTPLSLHDALPILRSSRRPARGNTAVTVTGRGRPCQATGRRSEEHTSELQSHVNLVCRLLLEKKKKGRKAEGRTYKITKRGARPSRRPKYVCSTGR